MRPGAGILFGAPRQVSAAGKLGPGGGGVSLGRGSCVGCFDRPRGLDRRRACLGLGAGLRFGLCSGRSLGLGLSLCPPPLGLGGALETGDIGGYCSAKAGAAAAAGSARDADEWKLMEVLCSPEQRRRLLYYLGVAEEEAKAAASSPPVPPSPSPSPAISASSFFLSF